MHLKFSVSKPSSGVKLQYGDPNGWAQIGHDSHGIIGFVDKGGVLGFDVFANPELRVFYGSGTDMFNSVLNRISSENVNVSGVRGAWMSGTDSVNYAQYRAGIAQGLTPEQAALNTWAGKLANQHGFSRVENIIDQGSVYRGGSV